MSLLGEPSQGDSDPNALYHRLGYRTNPFPKQGEVDGIVYVPRAELEELRLDLRAFLNGRDRGTVWAIQGAIGYGKSNFLRYVQREIDDAVSCGRLQETACRFIPSMSLTPQQVVQQLLLSIDEQRLVALMKQPYAHEVPESLRGTDFGRFWEHAPRHSATAAAPFLARWLGGQQTYRQEREVFGITARERLPPAVAFPYIRSVLDMLDRANLLKRIVVLLDEFEDVERLTKSRQNEYVQVLKTLLNAFNWRGLYVILAGQAAAFTTIGNLYPSLASRWRTVTLLPVQSTDDAVALAQAYKKAASLPGAQVKFPGEVDIKSAFVDLHEKQRPRPVSHRQLLTQLNEMVEQRVARDA